MKEYILPILIGVLFTIGGVTVAFTTIGTLGTIIGYGTSFVLILFGNLMLATNYKLKD